MIYIKILAQVTPFSTGLKYYKNWGKWRLGRTGQCGVRENWPGCSVGEKNKLKELKVSFGVYDYINTETFSTRKLSAEHKISSIK